MSNRRVVLRYGTTASAVSSLSLDPPMLLVCLNRSSSTQQAIAAAGHFAVNILAEGQADEAMRFAGKGDKFAGVNVLEGTTGEPLLAHALANLECRVVEEVSGGTHSVFLAEVEHATGRQGHAARLFPRQVRASRAGPGRRRVPRHPGARHEPRAARPRAARPRRRRLARRRPARLGLPRAHQALGRGSGQPHGRRPLRRDAADGRRGGGRLEARRAIELGVAAVGYPRSSCSSCTRPSSRPAPRRPTTRPCST